VSEVSNSAPEEDRSTSGTDSYRPRYNPRNELKIEEAIQTYLEDRENELHNSTWQDYNRSLDEFHRFCNLEGITHLHEITGLHLREYKDWRKYESSDKVDELSPKTVRDEMFVIRNFLRHLAKLEAVRPNIHDKVIIPTLDPEDQVRDKVLATERAKRILDHLAKYEYASLDHVVWILLYASGGRISEVESLDVEDAEVSGDNLKLEFRHRPAKGTELKNDNEGERDVSIFSKTAEVIRDYIQTHRDDITDEYGRNPLLTGDDGRLSTSTIRKRVYKWCRPCQIRGECPHGKEIDDCSAANRINEASKCPSSRAPHDIRRTHITEQLKEGLPVELVSERCDVSPKVLKKHYDQRTEEERRQVREEMMKEIFDDPESGLNPALSGGDADE
jgi:site-specific recombinase XerD